MRTVIIILVLLFTTDLAYAQKVKRIIEHHFQVDSLNGKIVKTFEYDSDGILIIEKLLGFKPLGSKYRSTGTWIYDYKNGLLSTKTLVNRLEADTIVVSYKYSGSKVKVRRDELITESKIKDGLEYGDGTENGCIVPPEALEFYKVWVNRENKKVFYKNDKKQKEYAFFNHKTNPHNLIYQYSDEGKLIRLDQINRKTGQTNWIEKYTYTNDSVTRTREYLITYWGKIPPSEIETSYLNSDNLAVKTTIENSKDGEDGIIISEYVDGFLISQLWKNLQGTTIRKLEYQYE